MAMAQPKAQAPFIPGQKEAADLVPDEEESRRNSRSSRSSSSITGSNSSGIPGKFIRFFGNHSSDGKEQGDDGDAGRESKLQGDYYSPVRTELVSKGGADAVKDLYYSPGAAVGIVTSELKLPPSVETDEHEQRGEASGTLVSGPGLVEAGKGMASEVMEKLAGLQLPSESLDAVKHTVETSVKGAFTTTKDVVSRTKQSLFDILPSSLSSSNAHHARQVVEDMEKDMLANSEGSGEDLSQVSEGPEEKSAAETAPEFMRAKL